MIRTLLRKNPASQEPFYSLTLVIKEVWAIEGEQGGPVEFSNPIHAQNIQELIASITNWLINIGLAIAVLMLIYGALVFITAGGVETRVTQGRKILTWSVIGLATLLLAKGAEFVIRSFLA